MYIYICLFVYRVSPPDTGSSYPTVTNAEIVYSVYLYICLEHNGSISGTGHRGRFWIVAVRHTHGLYNYFNQEAYEYEQALINIVLHDVIHGT